jgi:thymidine kinase
MTKTTDPVFRLFVGPMFGGKTTKMLAALERARYRKRRILLCKPKRDQRYSFGQVMSHTGISWDAHNVATGKEIYDLAQEVDIVAVDEAFMIPYSAEWLITLFRQGKSVYVSSIQLSASFEPLEEIQTMFPYATHVEVCPAVCPITGRDAYYTISKQPVDPIQVGGSDIYEPRCFWEIKFNDY